MVARGVGLKPTSPEELTAKLLMDCLVDDGQTMTQAETKHRMQKKLENLIKDVRNGEPLKISQRTVTPKKKPPYTVYYVRAPHGSDNKIQKRSEYEVLLTWYSLYTGYEFDVRGAKTMAQLIDEFITHLIESYIDVPNPQRANKPQTINRKQRDLTKYIANTDLGKKSFRKITASELQEELLKIVDEMKPRAKFFSQILGYLNGKKESVFKYAIFRGYIEPSNNPMDKVNCNLIIAHCRPDAKHEKNIKVLSLPQYKQYCNILTEQRQAKPSYVPLYAAEFGVYTGARIGEIAALKWSDIHWNTDSKQGYIEIKRSEHRNDNPDGSREWTIGNPKSANSKRVIPLIPQVEEMLHQLEKYGAKNADGFIFANENGERMRQTTISNAIEELNRKKIFPIRLSQHMIRKTVSSVMHHAGATTGTISSILGHDPITNEEFYSFSVADYEEKRDLLTSVAPV